MVLACFGVWRRARRYEGMPKGFARLPVTGSQAVVMIASVRSHNGLLGLCVWLQSVADPRGLVSGIRGRRQRQSQSCSTGNARFWPVAPAPSHLLRPMTRTIPLAPSVRRGAPYPNRTRTGCAVSQPNTYGARAPQPNTCGLCHAPTKRARMIPVSL